MKNPHKIPLENPVKSFARSPRRVNFALAITFAVLGGLFVAASIWANDFGELAIVSVFFFISALLFTIIGCVVTGPANPLKRNLKNLGYPDEDAIDRDVNENGPLFSRKYMNKAVLMGDEYLLYRGNGGRRSGGQPCGVIRLSDIVWIYTVKTANASTVVLFGAIGALFSRGMGLSVYVAGEKYAHLIPFKNAADAEEVLACLREAAPAAMIGSDRELAKRWRKDRNGVLAIWQDRKNHLQEA